MTEKIILGKELYCTYELGSDLQVWVREYSVEVELPHSLGTISIDRDYLTELLAEAEAKQIGEVSG